jgi:PBSX family phage terminase large subunit
MAKRTKAQRERDLAAISVRYLRGDRQADIAAELGLTQSTVSRGIKELQQRWKERSERDFDQALAEELAKIDDLEREYWMAWVRSQESAETTVVQKERPVVNDQKLPIVKEKAKKTVRGQTGDPRFLAGVERCIAQRRELLRLNEVSQDAGGDVVDFSIPAHVLSPQFLEPYRDIRDAGHLEYLFYGGRGSTKSSAVSLFFIDVLINNPSMHGLATRQVKDTLRDSVFAQLRWAIMELGLEDKFKETLNPMEITYIPTGQKIYFRGGDDPIKVKSIKPAFGYIGVLWFEELDQFKGAESVRSIEQSAIRGGDLAYIFKSFNPPRTIANWANKYVKIPKPNQYQHFSNYLDVPPRWLGKPFLDEAEHLKTVNPAAHEHEYGGIANGAGGQVFENVVFREISDEEIYGAPDEFGRLVGGFDRVQHGLDFGYYPDPAHYARVHYDAARRTLYVFGEVRQWKASNRKMYDAMVEAGYDPSALLIADSAEPKSVADYREYGANVRGAEKGADSVDYSIKWLQGLSAIVIDPKRAPYAADEFLEYEYEKTRDGEIISAYPDKNNHAIDATRYATNLIWRVRGQ